MRTSRFAVVVTLSTAAFALLAGCESPGGGGVRPIAGLLAGKAQVVHTITAPYSQWSTTGFTIKITSTKQTAVVDGHAMPSIFAATVHLNYDTNKNIVDATGPANDFQPIPVHGEKLTPAELMPKGDRTLTLASGGNTHVDPATFFTVTITEIDPM